MYDAFGRKEDAVVSKVNMSRKLNRAGQKFVSSITLKAHWGETNEKPDKIVFKDFTVYKILDAAKHCLSYLFFSKYDIKNINEILAVK